MLHGIINEQGNCLDVRDDISEKKNIFHMFPIIFSLSAIILGIIDIADNKPINLCYRWYIYINFLSHISKCV